MILPPARSGCISCKNHFAERVQERSRFSGFATLRLLSLAPFDDGAVPLQHGGRHDNGRPGSNFTPSFLSPFSSFPFVSVFVALFLFLFVVSFLRCKKVRTGTKRQDVTWQRGDDAESIGTSSNNFSLPIGSIAILDPPPCPPVHPHGIVDTYTSESTGQGEAHGRRPMRRTRTES